MKEYTSCPVCDSKQFNTFNTCKDYTVSKNEFTIVKCANCSFTFTNPIPLESEIGKYYESDEYISHSNTSKGFVNSAYQFVRNYTLNKKVKLLKSLSNDKTLLDIGSGTGEFLNTSKSVGYLVSGIEPSATGREQSLENFNIKVGEEPDLDKLDANSFGFITMWHVLEHVYHLNERIIQLNRLLKNDGHLIIAVPNRESFDAKHYEQYWAAYDVPRHLYHFTPNTIELLFKKHGFSLYKTLPMKFDSFYVSMLSEKYKTGKSNLVKAFLVGLQSNLKASQNTYSSQIYIFRKQKTAQ